MQQQRNNPHPRTAIAMTAALIVLSGPAAADKDQPELEFERTMLSSELILQEEPPAGDVKNWFRANVRTIKKYGFQYSHGITTKNRDRQLIFSIKGPLIKKKTPGLALEILF